MEVTKQPIRMNTSNLNHYLAIGDFYLYLKQNGNLIAFETELRERFAVGTKEKLYCPDAFFIWNGKIYVLEVQITPTSKDRWSKKHEIRNLFFDPIRNYYHAASFQKYARNDKLIKPLMVIWSKSKESNVSHGSKERLIIFKELVDFPAAIDNANERRKRI